MSTFSLCLRPVGDDADVHPGSLRISRWGSGSARRPRPRGPLGPSRAARRSCRAPRPPGVRPRPRRRPPPRSGARRARRGQPPQRGQVAVFSSSVGSRSGRGHPEQVEVGAQALRRAPRAAYQSLRPPARGDQAQQPLGRPPGGVARSSSRVPTVSLTRRCFSTLSATWRSAVSRRACRFSSLKNELSAASTGRAGRRVPSRRRWSSISGVMSIRTTWSAAARIRSGKVSRSAGAGELGHRRR